MQEIIRKTIECAQLDCENITKNGFNTVEEVLEYYRVVDVNLLLKIHGEYFGGDK